MEVIGETWPGRVILALMTGVLAGMGAMYLADETSPWKIALIMFALGLAVYFLFVGGFQQAVACAFMLLPFPVLKQTGGTTYNVTEIFIVGIAIWAGLVLSAERSGAGRARLLFGTTLWVTGFLLPGVLASSYPSTSISTLGSWALGYAAFVISVTASRSEKGLRLLLRGAVWGLLLVAAYSVIQSSTGLVFNVLGQSTQIDPSFVYGSSVRVPGPFGHPNLLGGYAHICAPIAFAYALAGRDRERWIGVVATVAALLSAFLSQSRGGWVAVTVGMIVVWLLSLRRLRWSNFLVGLTALGGMLITLVGVYGARVVTAFDRDYPSNVARIVVWRQAMRLIQQHWILGIGLGGFQEINPILKHAQNLYLNVFVELGIVGLLGLVVMSVLLCRTAWRVYVASPSQFRSVFALGFLGTISAALAHGVVDYLLLSNQLLMSYWALAGILLASAQSTAAADGTQGSGDGIAL